MINFGIVYGHDRLRPGATGCRSPRTRPRSSSTRYLERFPAVRAYIDHTIAFATAEGYVTTLFGRRRQIPELKARQRQVRALGERLAVNTPIQGSAADIIKVAMVRAHDALRDAGLKTAPDPADPRRAALRGARGRGRAGHRDRRARDGAGVPARSAAGRGRRRGQELDGGQIRAALLGGVVLAVALLAPGTGSAAAASGCAGTSAHREVAPVVSYDPQPSAPRVFAMQFQQDPRNVVTYSTFKRKVDCLLRADVVPRLAHGRPNLVVFTEDIGLMTGATGTRGATARALWSRAGTPSGCAGMASPCQALAGLSALGDAYAPAGRRLPRALPRPAAAWPTTSWPPPTRSRAAG